MELRAFLAAFSNNGFRIESIINPPIMSEVSQDISTRFPVGGEFPTEDSIQENLEIIFDDAEQEWKNITNKQWKSVTWALWVGEKILPDNPKSLEAYVRWISKSNLKSSYRTLIASYIYSYQSTNRVADIILPLIVKEVSSWNKDSWYNRHQIYDLFVERKAHTKISDACLVAPYDFNSEYQKAGLVGMLETSGLAKETYEHILGQIKDILLSSFDQNPTIEMLSSFLQWSLYNNSLKYPNSQVIIINALLEPWSDKDPSDNIRELIMEWLINNFHDPRMKSSEWHGASDTALSVIKRWLTKESLEQFLRIVDETAEVEMWDYRRAFWGSYFKAGYMSEAWVAFAEDGFLMAKQTFEQQNYARLSGNGVKSDHAVLIMKVGSLTVADWSHNGKCHIWKEDNSEAPKLYEKRYSRIKLINNSDMIDNSSPGQVHYNSAGGTWQRKVAKYIKNETDFRLNNNQFMP